MSHALGIIGKSFNHIRIGEFTEEQVQDFLLKQNIAIDLPDWLPRKPLLLGYLASRKLLQPALSIDTSQGFGYAWNQFLQLICSGEAQIEETTLDPETARRLLERLACHVRSTVSGNGPIT